MVAVDLNGIFQCTAPVSDHLWSLTISNKKAKIVQVHPFCVFFIKNPYQLLTLLTINLRGVGRGGSCFQISAGAENWESTF